MGAAWYPRPQTSSSSKREESVRFMDSSTRSHHVPERGPRPKGATLTAPVSLPAHGHRDLLVDHERPVEIRGIDDEEESARILVDIGRAAAGALLIDRDRERTA